MNSFNGCDQNAFLSIEMNYWKINEVSVSEKNVGHTD